MDKLIIIGLDGGTFSIIDEMTEEELPFLKGLIKNGVRGVLKSTYPPLTGPAWTSLYTGVNPGKHGIFDWQRINREGDREFINANHNSYPYFWNLTGEKVILVNLPITYPPKPQNGVLICGFPSPPKSDYTYPTTLRQDIEAIGYVGGAMKAKSEGQDADLYKVSAKTVEVFSHLIKRHDWTTAFIVIKETDSINHKTGCKSEAKKLYRHVDKLLRDFLPKGCTYLILSDHGSTWCNYAFFLNNWLKEAGFLEYELEVVPSYDLVQNWMEDVYAPRTILTRIFERFSISRNLLLNILRKAHLEWLKRFVPRWFKASVPLANVIPDWKVTKAYPYSMLSWAININLQGRERCGSVKKEDYELVKEDLVKKLNSVTNPSNKRRCFKEVLRREEIFKGENLNCAPDIIYQEEDGLMVLVNKNSPNGTFIAEYKGSRHAMEGIFIASGDGIKKGVTVRDLNIVDICPTILHMRGKKIPDYIDGEVRKEIFEEKSEFFQREISYDGKSSTSQEARKYTYSEEEKKAIEESLRSLGYL